MKKEQKKKALAKGRLTRGEREEKKNRLGERTTQKKGLKSE